MRSLKEQLMKSVCTGFIFAGSLIVGAIEVEAQSSVSVNKLLPACRSFASGTGDATYTQGMCAGIIFGLDALGSDHDASRSDSCKLCRAHSCSVA
jgi:hypothetical protein